MVWDALKRRIALGATVVAATHERDAAASLAAREIRLEQGGIVAEAAPTATRTP